MTTLAEARPVESSSELVADALTHLLGDTYVLYLKTHGYHWNVSGPHFRSLHLMFEEQYEELAAATDEIAERIRTLGHQAPGSYAQMARVTSLAEDEGVPEAMEMARRLAADHRTVVATACAALEVAQAADDPATMDLVTRRIAAHEKALWMLRETAGGEA